jgi:hypothetical protein
MKDDACGRFSAKWAVFHPSALLFLAVWLFLLFAGRGAMLRDPGSFWHVAAGEKMLSTGHVLRNDPFSFTVAGHPWVADQWLAECGMAAVHRLAGWDGLLLLAATILAAIYTWIALRLLGSGWHWLPAGLLLALILLIGSPQFHVRPLVATLGLLSVSFAWLVDVEAGKRPLRQLWWLVPLVVLWANLHGGVLGGIGTVGFCTAGWCLAWALTWFSGSFRSEQTPPNCNGGNSSVAANSLAATQQIRSPVRHWSSAIELLALLTALAAATLVNPYGLQLPREWMETLAMPLPSIIDEHRPLDFTEPTAWATVLLAAGYLVVLGGVFPRRPRVTWLVPLAWFVLALGRVRNAPLLAVVAAIALADMLPNSRVGKWLAHRDMLTAPRPSIGWRLAVWPMLLVLVALVLQVAGVAVPIIGRGWARFDPARWPVGLLPQLEEIDRSAGEGPRIFNDLNFGGFLIYHAPRLPIFIDDRCALYGTDFLQAYDRARRENPAQLDRWRQQYGFHYALVETGGRFDHYLAGATPWGLVARTPPATLYRYMGVSAAKH